MKINRLHALEQYILAQQTVTIEELCQVFGMSKNTIRRDLNELEARGHVSKVYGGVTATHSTTPGASYPQRTPADKNSIGQLAAAEVHDGDTIFVDGEALCLIPHLSAHQRVTVVTHALAVMQAVARQSHLNLIALGGVYTPATDTFMDLHAYETLSHLHLQKAFLSAHGISLAHGITHDTYLEAEMKKGAVRCAEQVFVLADARTLEQVSMVSYASRKEITALITDCRPADKLRHPLEEHGVRVLFPH